MSARRYHMRTGTHLVEFPFTDAGLEAARVFRQCHPQFKRRHIRDILQLMPSRVPYGVVVECTNKESMSHD